MTTQEELQSLFSESPDEADEESLLFRTDSLILNVKVIASVLWGTTIINERVVGPSNAEQQQKNH